MNKNKIKKPEWISSSLWNKLLYEIWQIMSDTWQLFYRYDTLHKIYFYLARQLDKGVVITGYTIYLPYSNKGSMICIYYRCSQNIKRALEITVDGNRELMSYHHNLSDDKKDKVAI